MGKMPPRETNLIQPLLSHSRWGVAGLSLFPTSDRRTVSPARTSGTSSGDTVHLRTWARFGGFTIPNYQQTPQGRMEKGESWLALSYC